jgi:hypothetical protein
MEQFLFGLRIFAGLVGVALIGFVIYVAIMGGVISGSLPRFGRAVWHFPGNLARKIWANASPLGRLPSGEMPPKLRIVKPGDSPVEPPEGQGIYSLNKRRLRKYSPRQWHGSDRAN